LEHGDCLKVADILLKDWDNGALAWIEQNAVGHFLVRCGFLRAFMDQVCENLKTGRKIPWPAFAEALGKSQITLGKEDFDQIFVGAAEEQSLKDLVRCTELDARDPRFEKIRNSMDHTVLRAETSQKKQQDGGPAGETEAQGKAAPVFESEVTSPLLARLAAKDAGEKALAAEAKKIFLAAAGESSDAYKEAAVALAMMDAWAEGLELLRLSPPSFERSLLELEFLHQAGRDVEALDLAESLLTQMPNLEQKSHIQFLQAQAFLKLKKPREAHEVLENLIADNPDHLAARTLLNHVKAGHIKAGRTKAGAR
jgi:hypothetical protein